MKILAVACPHCGAPTRVSLASPDAVRCLKCGYSGLPPPEAHRALQAAREVLASLDKRGLRITGLQRGVLLGAVGGVGIIGVLFVVVFLVMALVSALGIALAVWKQELRLGVLFGLPLVTYLVAGVLGLVALKLRLSKAQLACSAIPPDTPGAACGCRVCGADLPPRKPSDDAVLTCGYCSADNLVDEACLRRAGATREYVLTRHEDGVRSAAAEVSAHIAVGIVGVFVLAVVSGYAGCVVSAKVGEVDDNLEVAAPAHRYALVQTGSGLCVGRLRDLNEQGTGELYFASPLPKGWSPWYARQKALNSYPAFSASQLIGRTALQRKTEGLRSPRGVISRVYARKGDRDEALVKLTPDPGDEEPVALTSLCLENASGFKIRTIETE